MCEWNMVIGDFVEEMDLVLSQHQSSGNGMHWRIAPSLIKEATVTIKGIKIVKISIGPQPVQASDLEVRPLQ